MPETKLVSFKDLMKAKQEKELAQSDSLQPIAQAAFVQTDKSHKNGLESDNKTPRKSQAQTKPRPALLDRDFNKRANSIERDALPAGLFPNSCKAIYDALYLKTHGSFVQTDKIQATYSQLISWSGIKNIKTIKASVKKLRDNNLLEVTTVPGEQSGSWYSVKIPGKNEHQGQAQTTRPRPVPSPSRKLDSDPAQSLGWAGPGNLIENKDTYAVPKTLIKTLKEKDDDEPQAAAFSEMNKILQEAARKVTGKGTSIADRERWNNIAHILATQLEIIASRTPISNAPAVLAEHLHRLLNSRKAQEQLGLITPAEAKSAREAENKKQKTAIPDLHLCPDCYGSGFHNPDGKGKRPGCAHSRLEEARERAKLDEKISE